MKRKQLKFAIGSAVIILTLAYLGYSGYQENKTYYHTVPELAAMKEKAYGLKLQVSGTEAHPVEYVERFRAEIQFRFLAELEALG